MKATALCVSIALALVLALAGQASAAITFYFDQTAYLTDLALQTSNTISEGFEGSDWDGTRYPAGMASVTTQGLTWTTDLDAVSTSDGWAHSGSWGVFDNFGDPDRLIVNSNVGKLVGFGGFFAYTDAADVSLYLDGVYHATLLDAPSWSWPNYNFFGAIDTDGFTSVRFQASSGHWGADDFTAGVQSSVVPEPTSLLLLGFGLLGLGAFFRRSR